MGPDCAEEAVLTLIEVGNRVGGVEIAGLDPGFPDQIVRGQVGPLIIIDDDGVEAGLVEVDVEQDQGDLDVRKNGEVLLLHLGPKQDDAGNAGIYDVGEDQLRRLVPVDIENPGPVAGFLQPALDPVEKLGKEGRVTDDGPLPSINNESRVPQ